MLSEAERRRVADAVAEAEAGLSAEIVPAVWERSSPYPETVWGGAASASALASAALFLRDLYDPSWLPLTTQVLAVPAAGLLGAALGRWCAPLQRLLIGDRRMRESAERRAKELFFDRGVAATSHRRGVLIFASLLERRVVVLADREVAVKAPPESWDQAVRAMTEAARGGRVADGLIAAVRQVAVALRRAGFEGGRGDEELGDEPLTGGGR